jgi:hypothetical protein
MSLTSSARQGRDWYNPKIRKHAYEHSANRTSSVRGFSV